jgi:hypothetical protein
LEETVDKELEQPQRKSLSSQPVLKSKESFSHWLLD